MRQPVFEMSQIVVEMPVSTIRQRKAGEAAAGTPHILAAYTVMHRQSDAAPCQPSMASNSRPRVSLIIDFTKKNDIAAKIAKPV